MLYARAGHELEVELSHGEINTYDGNSELYVSYMGGRGVATRLFWDRVAPEVSPFSDDNMIIFSPGLLTGTLIPGANRTSIVTRSPQTNLLTYSTLGGAWGAELKHAGYDSLLISGKSPTPVYLWIKDDEVEIRDARHIWGMDTRETRRIIQQELNQDKVQIVCIGPAGENRAYAASIEHNFGTSASRAGIGAVMGDKNIKAIAVYGTKDLSVANPTELNELCQDIIKKTSGIKKYWDNWVMNTGKWLLNEGLYGNLDKRDLMENYHEFLEEFVKKYKKGIVSCYNCGIGCKSELSLLDGNYAVVKCGSWFPFLLACKIRDLQFNMKCHYLCEIYGMDVVSTANVIAFAIDIYEKGILTNQDTQGIHLEWKNEAVAYLLIEKIARREGIGDVLANGVYKAAQQIGKGAEKYAYHLKKLEPIAYNMYKPYSALRSAITDKPDMTRSETFFVYEYLNAPKDIKKAYIEKYGFSYPKELEKVFLEDFIGLEKDYKKIVPFTSADVDTYALADCSGLCMFWLGFWDCNPINSEDHLRLLTYGSGIENIDRDAIKIANKVNAMTRAYNVLVGLRRKDDTIPEKFFKITPEPPLQKMDKDKFNTMISEFYELRGWNNDGIPSKEELHRLGLVFVSLALEERGML